MAPGNITIASDGSQVSWTTEGNNDSVIVTDQYNNVLYQTACCDAVSPVVIPPSVYPASGSYYFTVQVANKLTSVPGAGAGSNFMLYDINYTMITR